VAINKSKAAGRKGLRFFDSCMEMAIEARMALEPRLDRAPLQATCGIVIPMIAWMSGRQRFQG
jgi:hypothetical protein